MKLPALETSDWYALLMPVYTLVLMVELAVAYRRRAQWFSFAETLSNLTAGIGTLLLGLFLGPVVLGLYTWAWAHLALLHWPSGPRWSAGKWAFSLLLCDLCYYAWHRAGHTFGALWAIHGIHHQHERLNSSVGLRLEWPGDLVAAFFFAPLPLLGIDAATGFSTIAVLSAYTLTAHMPLLARPTWGIFVTPAVHGAHHSRDLRFLGKNFGAMLSIWDRLCGTYLEPERGTVFGSEVPTVSRTHDGVSAQWSLLAELGANLRQAPDRRAAWRLLADPPDWRKLPPRVPRDEARLGLRERGLLLARFLGLAAFASWVWWLQAEHPPAVKLAGALLAGWGLRTVGGRVDGRAGVARAEVAWCGGAAVVAATIASSEPLGSLLLAANLALTIVPMLASVRAMVPSAPAEPLR